MAVIGVASGSLMSEASPVPSSQVTDAQPESAPRDDRAAKALARTRAQLAAIFDLCAQLGGLLEPGSAPVDPDAR